MRTKTTAQASPTSRRLARDLPLGDQHRRMRHPAAAHDEREDNPDVPGRRGLRQPEQSGHREQRELALVPAQEPVGDVPAVELAQRNEVESGDEGPHPPGECGQTEVYRRGSGKQPVPQEPGQHRFTQEERLADQRDIAGRRAEHDRNPLRGEVPPHQDADRDHEPGEGTCRADVEKLPAIHDRAAYPDERAQASDGRERGRDGNEVGRRAVDGVPPGREIMSQLVHAENGEQGHREGPAYEERPSSRPRRRHAGTPRRLSTYLIYRGASAGCTSRPTPRRLQAYRE